MTYLKHKPFYIFHKLLKQKQNKKKHLKKKTKKHITWVRPIKEREEDTQTDWANCKAIQTHKFD